MACTVDGKDHDLRIGGCVHPDLARTLRTKLYGHYAGSTECFMCPPAGMKAFDVWNAREGFIGPWETDADSMYSCRTR